MNMVNVTFEDEWIATFKNLTYAEIFVDELLYQNEEKYKNKIKYEF